MYHIWVHLPKFENSGRSFCTSQKMVQNEYFAMFLQNQDQTSFPIQPENGPILSKITTLMPKLTSLRISGSQVIPGFRHDVKDRCYGTFTTLSTLPCSVMSPDCFPYGSWADRLAFLPLPVSWSFSRRDRSELDLCYFKIFRIRFLFDRLFWTF